MNDFTKEELQYLHACIYERPTSVIPRMDAIRDKIQSMIDNYCEHDIDYGHLTDKHIGQWVGYLVEEFPRWKDLEKVLMDNPELDEILLKIYKKGFQDCKTEGGTK